MNINRHNYEEFFLLYADDELTLHQRLEVELFLSRHPDLQAEFEALLNTRLTPEELAYEGKEELFSDRMAGSVLTPLASDILLLVDNELPADRRELLDARLLSDQEAGFLLKELMNTRLHAEPVSCPDKAGLYRRTPVITPAFMRIAAAASVLLITGIAWWSYEKAPHAVVAHKITYRARTAMQPEILPEDPRKNNGASLSAPRHASRELTASVTQPVEGASSARPDPELQAIEPAARQASNPEVTGIQLPQDRSALTIILPSAPEASQASQLKEVQMLDEQDDEGLAIGAIELNRNKVQGLLRKAAGLFTARLKRQDK